MRTFVRIHLRRKHRNASEDLGIREVETIPAVGDEMRLRHRSGAVRAIVLTVVLQGFPDLNGLLVPLLYLAER